MRIVKQNDTTKKLLFVMYDSTDHVTPKTGLTPSVQISKNGAAFANGGGTVSELGSGWYVYTFAAADVDTLGPLAVKITATGADPVNVVYWVVAYDPYSSVNLGLSNLDTNVASRSSHSAADVWAVATRTITGGTVDNVANPVTIDMEQPLPTTPVAGTTGQALRDADDYLDATVSSRSTFNPATDHVIVGTNNDKTGYTLTSAEKGSIADAVWDELQADHTAAGSFGALLDVSVSSRATAADVWAYATRGLTEPVQIDMGQVLPATPAPGTTGAALKDADDYLDVAVSTRSTFDAASEQVTVATNNDKTGYQLAATEHDAIADATLKRGVSSVEASAPEHSLCTVVLAMLESERSGTSWTIYRTDGATVHVSKTLQTDANAEPVVKVE